MRRIPRILQIPSLHISRVLKVLRIQNFPRVPRGQGPRTVLHCTLIHRWTRRSQVWSPGATRDSHRPLGVLIRDVNGPDLVQQQDRGFLHLLAAVSAVRRPTAAATLSSRLHLCSEEGTLRHTGNTSEVRGVSARLRSGWFFAYSVNPGSRASAGARSPSSIHKNSGARGAESSRRIRGGRSGARGDPRGGKSYKVSNKKHAATFNTFLLLFVSAPLCCLEYP